MIFRLSQKLGSTIKAGAWTPSGSTTICMQTRRLCHFFAVFVNVPFVLEELVLKLLLEIGIP